MFHQCQLLRSKGLIEIPPPIFDRISSMAHVRTAYPTAPLSYRALFDYLYPICFFNFKFEFCLAFSVLDCRVPSVCNAHAVFIET